MTGLVDPQEIEWLRADSLFAEAADPAIAAAWGADAVSTRIFSPYAHRADALAEAERQRQWFRGPLVEDVHIVPGLRADLYLAWIELEGTDLDYAEPRAAFVVDVAELDDATTRITVLRPL